jgi:hypothetical protein
VKTSVAGVQAVPGFCNRFHFKFVAYSINEVFGNGWNLWGLDWKHDKRRRGGIDAKQDCGNMENEEF